MGAPAYNTEILLPNNEGKLRLIVESWKTPSIEKISSKIIQDSGYGELLIHDSCSQRFIARTLSPQKRVMFCKECGLRLEIPQRITLGELSLLFSKKPLPPFTR